MSPLDFYFWFLPFILDSSNAIRMRAMASSYCLLRCYVSEFSNSVQTAMPIRPVKNLRVHCNMAITNCWFLIANRFSVLITKLVLRFCINCVKILFCIVITDIAFILIVNRIFIITSMINYATNLKITMCKGYQLWQTRSSLHLRKFHTITMSQNLLL